MSSLQQIQSFVYAFVVSMVLLMVYAFLNRLFYRFEKSIFRLVIQVLMMSGFGFLTYWGLVMIQGGVVRLYQVVVFIIGYFFYQFFYASGWQIFLEYIMLGLSKVFFPILFLFRKIRAILKIV
ncbi:spore cortex biosynthesis protein YabQ [Tannockella kyphosi]|uniref:spore cortex biosynthesis protein YabQ n=1 Tax=Tannockella kyphosi TaxID=2899121 RepID=UPI0037DA1DE4